ncbi:hypothetical protein K439DRAFT_1642109 [Ramaria rubella]|nr:hypothetical protein K439DRAFT_1642109 [Ramaria rubella]
MGKVALPALAITVLAWWVSSTVIPATRHRWIVQTLWAWLFVLIIIFRFIPATIVSRPVSAIWDKAVAGPVSHIQPRGRLALMWLGAIAITFGTTFGFARPSSTTLVNRVISLAGVYFFQILICLHSIKKGGVNWIRIPLSIILQQALALFVLKSSAGFSIFTWFSTAVADFQSGAIQATAFIFDAETATKGWFFVSGLAPIIFLAAFVQMLYFFNWMQWLTKQFAWLGQKVFGASGAETFVALWSPWFGQANSAILIGAYVESLTDSEIFAVMATSMCSLSSLTIRTYTTTLAIPARNLIAQSAMIIPSSIINAKVAVPETDPEAPMTRSRESTCAARKKINLRKAVDLLDCLSDGALLGLRVAGSVLVNFFMIFALLVFVDGICIWIFRGFGVHALDIHQLVAAPLVPCTFFLGVPRREVWGLSYMLSGKLLVSSDFAYASLAKIMAGPQPLSDRSFQIITFALANTSSLASLGTQVGVMTALAPSRKSVICKAAIPALLVALLSAFQTAAIAGSLL